MKRLLLLLLLFTWSVPQIIQASEDDGDMKASSATHDTDSLSEQREAAASIMLLSWQKDSLSMSKGASYKNNRYWQRYKVQNLTGSLLLGAGLVGTGLAVAFNVAFNGLADGDRNSGWMFVIPGAITLSSIPFFISAHHNKKKAMAFAKSNQQQSDSRDWKRTGLRFEVAGGLTWPIGQGELGDENLGLCIAGEARSYLGNSNFDLAVRLGVDYTRLSNNKNKAAFRLAVVSDYNLQKGRKVNPFIGAGIGISLPAAPFVMPRIGVELNDHHRISLYPHICLGDKSHYDDNSKRLTNLCLTYGYTF